VSPTGCSSKQGSVVILIYIFLRDFTTSWDELLSQQQLSSAIVVWPELFEPIFSSELLMSSVSDFVCIAAFQYG
jgi:hypothetical protein